MKHSNTIINYYLVKKLLTIQLGAALLVITLFRFYSDYEALFSAFLGGLIGIIPGLVFALLYFKQSGAKALKKVVQNFYLGEVLKLFLTLLLFTAAFQWSKLKPLPMFSVFITTLMAYWVILGNLQVRREE